MAAHDNHVIIANVDKNVSIYKSEIDDWNLEREFTVRYVVDAITANSNFLVLLYTNGRNTEGWTTSHFEREQRPISEVHYSVIED